MSIGEPRWEDEMSDEKIDNPVFLYTTKLVPVGLFATHDSFEKLQDYADQHNGSEAAIAALFIGLTYNTCAAVMEEALVGEMPASHLGRILSLVDAMAAATDLPEGGEK